MHKNMDTCQVHLGGSHRRNVSLKPAWKTLFQTNKKQNKTKWCLKMFTEMLFIIKSGTLPILKPMCSKDIKQFMKIHVNVE
jgi:hypothetical protein